MLKLLLLSVFIWIGLFGLTNASDNCSLGSHNCNGNAVCVSTNTSFTCQCKEGFAGDGLTCSDINECSYYNFCGQYGYCRNLVGSFYCYCFGGFTDKQGDNCLTKDQCLADHRKLDDSDCNQGICFKPGLCNCSPGYELDLVIYFPYCTDVNECFLDYCHLNSTCKNTLGSYTCTCNSGYSGDLLECEDVNECVLPNNCSYFADCINTPGSYNCSCKDGFTGNGQQCEDINECFNSSLVCHSDETCVNIHGGFYCECKSGEPSCNDFDECSSNTTNLCHEEHATCNNTVGSYTCSCNPGFNGDGLGCVDIDECGGRRRYYCGGNSLCLNTVGSFYCLCWNGFQPEYSHFCLLPSDCQEDTYACSWAYSICYKGGKCSSCGPGLYIPPGSSCQDIDECSLNFCHQNSTCRNTYGSYTCTCNSGYPGDLFECEDVNECVLQNYCNQYSDCINTPESYNCSCKMGFTGNGRHCEDINECSLDPCHVNATCVNSPGSYLCECGSGYSGNASMCEDVNECILWNTCHENATCINTAGSYVCICKAGFSGNGLDCQDIDECQEYNTQCSTYETCVNTNGSYICACAEGFIYSGGLCIDKDECASQPCQANALCTNTQGSFTCSCVTGFSGDGQNCTDLDECALNYCHEDASCRNIYGGYECVCNVGFSGNGKYCEDIDECALQQP